VIREARAQTDVIDSETLPEFFPISAAPKHFPQVAGQKKQQTERPEKIVEKTNHPIRCHVERSRDIP
jgi:hypothetical protein